MQAKHSRNQLVYDLPTRLFHWIFATLFLISFTIAQTVEDDSSVFLVHMFSGMMLSAAVVLRVVWGLIGSRHARFSGFAFHPRELMAYFQGLLRGSKRRWAGHNPASSWAGVVMMLLGVSLGITGVLMTATEDKELFEDVHEWMAIAFAVTAASHVAGIVLHSLRHRDAIGLSMMDGRKMDIAIDEVVPQTHRLAACVGLALWCGFGAAIYLGFDRASGVLRILGLTLQLG